MSTEEYVTWLETDQDRLYGVVRKALGELRADDLDAAEQTLAAVVDAAPRRGTEAVRP